MIFTYPEGATPLNQDEVHNLMPLHLTTQSELDTWEQWNILQAEEWAFKTKKRIILSIEFAQKLHHKMFDNTWKWAGVFRKTQTNIGVESVFIRQELKVLFGDIEYLLEHEVYSTKEIAVRLHHRLVLIHPWTNGNGRFSRIFADLMMFNYNLPRFSWGSSSLVHDSSTRAAYLKALRDADKHDYTKLLEFVDS